jgi:hypothetical protein
MSAPFKLRPGNSELTKLKELWRGLSEDARAFWQELFVSKTAQAEIRSQLLAKLKINLRFDKQLNAFRSWELEQRAMDDEAERAAEAERRITEEHPDWTKDQVREDLLRRFYNQARVYGDSQLGLKTIAADVKVESLKFDQEKFKEGLRTKIESGLAELATHIKSNPKAQAAYEAFRAEVKAATK